jgi:hypothetical protein
LQLAVLLCADVADEGLIGGRNGVPVRHVAA